MASALNEYITIPLKKGFEADLRPVLTFIESAQLSGNTHQYHQSISELMRLRSNFINTTDPGENTLQLYYRYGDQILSLESKIPLVENQVRVDFKWQDAFKSTRSSKSDNSLTMASGCFEKLSALFNVAAMQTAVAEQQNKYLDDGLKQAAKLYQQACGILSYASQLSPSCFVGVEATQDLQQPVLNTLATICLAQSQDIFVRKAMSDNMKSAVLSKLSEQAAYLYDEANKQAIYEPIKNLWPKDWLTNLAWKKLVFQALAQHFDACASQENKKYGVAQARIKNAKDIMSKAVAKCNCKPFPFLEQQKMIDTKLAQIEKENSFIFHETVPPINSLPPIDKAALAKPTAVGETNFSANFKDLLIEFVPLVVSQAARACDERRLQVVQKEVNRLKQANFNFNNALISLNLPACVEDISGERIPRSILEKSRQVRMQGGVHHLDRLINELPSMLTRCKTLMDDSERMLLEEEMSDKQLRGKYQGYWTRTPSEHLNAAIKEEIKKYRGVIGSALEADNAVKQRYYKEKNSIILLSQGDSDIENHLQPVGPEVQKLEGQASVLALKQLLAEVDALKVDRFSLEKQIKEADVNALAKFTAAYQKGGVIYEESLSLVELDKVYGPLREKVTRSISSQDKIIQKLQTALAEFNKAKGQGQQVIIISTNSRDVRLRELASAFFCYNDLSTVVEEGTKFYTDLVQLLEQFHQRIQTFCHDRNKERDLLLPQMPEITYQQVQPSPYTTQNMYQALPAHAYLGAQPVGQAVGGYYMVAAPVVYNPFMTYQ